jgi:hypothetical protein
MQVRGSAVLFVLAAAGFAACTSTPAPSNPTDGSHQDAVAGDDAGDAPAADHPSGVPDGGGAAGGAGGATSGGDGQADAGSAGGMTGAGGAGGATCGGARFDASPRPIDLFIVLDRSASMQDDSSNQIPTGPADPSKWSQVVPSLTGLIESAGASYCWGLKAFPEDGAQCAPTSVTTRIDTPVSAANSSAVTRSIALLAPAGNGTPTGAAIRVAASYLATLTDPNPKYLLLVTDGQPNCAGSAGTVVTDTTLGRTDAVAAVNDAARLGYHTFVIGVATSSALDAAVLNQLAIAGLEPRPAFRPGDQRYYLAATGAELDAALHTITGAILGCQLRFASAPPAADNVSVTLDGTALARDRSRIDGWDYADGSQTLIQLYGATCDRVQAKTVTGIQIDFGCAPASIPPDGGADGLTDAGTM